MALMAPERFGMHVKKINKYYMEYSMKILLAVTAPFTGSRVHTLSTGRRVNRQGSISAGNKNYCDCV